MKEAIKKLAETEKKKRQVKENLKMEFKNRNLECDLDNPPSYLGHALRLYINGSLEFPNQQFDSYPDFIEKISDCLKREKDLKDGLAKLGL